MTAVLVDDHLLRDLLTGEANSTLIGLVDSQQVYTTNLWYLRLCRSAAMSVGGRLTGVLTPEQRLALAGQLVALPSNIGIQPMADLAWQMAVRHASHSLSVLSCEALVAAERLQATICVWQGDAGPNLRQACIDQDVPYLTM